MVKVNKVLVLGASGMLGSAVFRAFCDRPDYEVVATVRSSSSLQYFTSAQQTSIISNIDVLEADALVSLFARVQPDVVVNCVGLVKQLSSAKDPLATLPLNSLLPHRLARLAALSRARLIHISTDCVFAGTKGRYTEESQPDATDLYGVSKHLGEVTSYDNAVTLRTSIIGRELASAHSLVDWFLKQKGEVKGFDKAIFSGLPTCELATIIRDFVIPTPSLQGLYHVSAAPISKYELLQLVAAAYKKTIGIIKDEQFTIDRSLDSTRFTNACGYKAPDWPELINRMHINDSRGDR